MRKFEVERRDYANKVHHLIVKKGTQAKKKAKNETKTENFGSCPTRKLDKTGNAQKQDSYESIKTRFSLGSRFSNCDFSTRFDQV